MSEVLDFAPWQALGLIIDQNTRDFLSGRYGLLQDAVAWFKAVDLLRAAQEERMVLRDPAPEDLRQHKTWLASLIAAGERLITELQQHQGLHESNVRFKPADVEATPENLRIDERMWHGETVTPSSRREILKAIFNVPEPLSVRRC